MALALAALLLHPVEAAASAWNRISTEHFDMYSQVEPGRAESLLRWLEQLRAFLTVRAIFPIHSVPSVRVVLFASPKEYEPFRAGGESDAYYASSETHRYIVMAQGPNERSIAAHELAHAALSSEKHMPCWLSEGLAEFFSSVRLDENGSAVGEAPLGHLQTLRQRHWLALSELLSQGSVPTDRANANLFYAESWALADMLVQSSSYSSRFQDLLASFGAGSSTAHAFSSVYRKPSTEIELDLHAWVAEHSAKLIRLPPVTVWLEPAGRSDVPDIDAALILSDMLASGGQWNHAESLLNELALKNPAHPDIPAALGTIALRKGDTRSARDFWKRAISQGTQDADLCYRYALLADSADLPPNEIRAALERAIALRPDFDDARYKLALLEKNAGHYNIAVSHLRGMHAIATARAFNYWITLADALNEVGKHDEAIAAARQAAPFARTPDERYLAAQLAYFAQTDVAVQFARDSSGRAEIVTTRVPHQSASDWNPFVEAGDDLHSVRGFLREIDCSGSSIGIQVEADGALLHLAISDPTRVRMRNAPDEFVCGPQESVPVEVQYAAHQSAGSNGLVRGIDFLR